MNFNSTHIPFSQTNHFSKLFLDYIENHINTQDLIAHKPDFKGFENSINQNKYNHENSIFLIQSIQEFYANSEIAISEKVKSNIQLLQNKNTFTVTTGHQLCLMTGPLYFIYKIITTINLAKKLKIQFPNKNFVPIYWMATEDHDFDEVNNFMLYGKTHTWLSNQKGAVGVFNLEGLYIFLSQILPENQYILHYKNKKNFAAATASFVNQLFENEGIVIVDSNQKSLKSLFKLQIKADIFDGLAYRKIAEQSKKIESLGYEAQVHAREINFFYLQPGFRERIIKEDCVFKVLNTSISFSENEMEIEIENHPERFSPNVCLRPLYQEVILPNIAYIGGPSEIAYWLQLKSFFDASNVSYPILFPRNFAMIVLKNQINKLQKLNINPQDLFLENAQLKKSYLFKKGQKNIDFEGYKAKVFTVFNDIKNEIISIDGSLEGYIEVQKNEISKQFDSIAKKNDQST